MKDKNLMSFRHDGDGGDDRKKIAASLKNATYYKQISKKLFLFQ